MKPINLNQARKARDKAQAKIKAEENAARFGRTKAQRLKESAQEEQAAHRLSQHKRDDR